MAETSSFTSESILWPGFYFDSFFTVNQSYFPCYSFVFKGQQIPAFLFPNGRLNLPDTGIQSRVPNVDFRQSATEWRNQTITLANIREKLNDFKPVNLVHHLVRIISGTAAEKFSAAVAVAELYGLLWSSCDSLVNFCVETFRFVHSAFPGLVNKLISTLVPECGSLRVPEDPSGGWKNESIEIQADGLIARFLAFISSVTAIDTTVLTGVAKPLLVVASFVVVVGSAIFGKAMGGVSTIVKYVVDALHVGAVYSKDLKELFMSPDSFFKNIMSACGEVFGFHYQDANTQKRQELCTRIQAYVTKLENLTKDVRVSMPKLLGNPAMLKDIEDDLAAIDKVYLDISKTGVNMSNAKSLLDRLRELADQIRSLHSNLLSSLHGKQEPATLWLFGLSGVGKSEAVQKIISALSTLEGRQLLSYTRSCQTEYWNGYCGQDIVVYDDFAADREGVDGTELDLIYSGQAMPVHMASIVDKKTVFSSRYVLICSNQAYIEHSAKLHDPSILDRRRDFLVQAVVKQTHKIPEGQACDENNINRIDYKEDCSHLEFRKIAVCRKVQDNKRIIGLFDNVPSIASALYEKQRKKAERFSVKLDQALQGWQHQFNPNVIAKLVFRRVPIVLLLGPPGTGKTTAVADLIPEHVINDCITQPEEVRQRILTAYDDGSDIPYLVITANDTDWAKFMNSLAADQAQAVKRRLRVFRFAWRRKNLLQMYDIRDLATQPHSKCVSIYDEKALKFTCVQDIIELLKVVPEQVLYKYRDAPHLQMSTADIVISMTSPLETVLACKSILDVTQHFQVLERADVSLPSVMSTLYMLWDRCDGLKLISDPVTMCVSLNNVRAAAIVEKTALVRFPDWTMFIVPIDGILVFGIADHAAYTFRDGQVQLVLNDQTYDVKDQCAVDFYQNLCKFQQVVVLSYDEVVAGRGTIIADSVPVLHSAIDTIDAVWFFLSVVGAAGAVVCDVNTAIQRNKDRKLLEQFHHETPPDDDPSTSMPKIRVKTRSDCQWRDTTPKWVKSAQEKYAWGKPAAGHFTADFVDGGAWGDIPWESEANSDPQARIVEEVVSENMVRIVSGVNFLCFGIMIFGRIGVTVAHAPDDVVIKTKYGIFGCQTIFSDPKRDVKIFRLSDKAPLFPNILHHMPKESEVADHSSYFACLITPGRISNHCAMRSVQLQGNLKIKVGDQDKEGICYKVIGGYSLENPLSTQAGDCGSPYILHNAKVPRKFLGFHTTANATMALGCILYQELFEAFKSQVGAEIVVLPHQCVLMSENPVYGDTPETAQFKYVGVSHDGKQIIPNKSRSKQTQLWKSPYIGVDVSLLGPTEDFVPSVLCHHDPRMTDKPSADYSPYEQAMNKWSHPQPEVDQQILDRVVSEWSTCVGDLLSHRKVTLGVLSDKEVINGCSRFASSHPLYRASSPGFPFTHWTEFKGKSKDVAFEQGSDGLFRFSESPGKKVKLCMEQLIHAARQKKRTAVVFAGSLKDELLKKGKVIKGITRSFAASPVDFTLAHRKYFHALSAACVDNRDQLPLKIGIVASSEEWEALYHYTTKAGKKGFDSDFKFWDAYTPKVFMSAVLKFCNNLYRRLDPHWAPSDDTIREGLFSCLEGPLLWYYDNIVQCPGGQVSGQPHTAFDNCIINMFYYYYIWLKLAMKHKPEYANFNAFREFVSFAVYGDDNICGISPKVISWFNFKNFKEECEALNLEVTPADKLSKDFSVKPVRELVFLKRYFRKFRGRYHGALEPSSFVKMCSYGVLTTRRFAWEKDDVRFDPATVNGIVISAMRESVLWGPEFYHSLLLHFQKCAATYSIALPHVPPFEDLYREVYFSVKRSGDNSIEWYKFPVGHVSTPGIRQTICNICKQVSCSCYCVDCGFLRTECACKELVQLCDKCHYTKLHCKCCVFCHGSNCICWQNQNLPARITKEDIIEQVLFGQEAEPAPIPFPEGDPVIPEVPDFAFQLINDHWEDFDDLGYWDAVEANLNMDIDYIAEDEHASLPSVEGQFSPEFPEYNNIIRPGLFPVLDSHFGGNFTWATAQEFVNSQTLGRANCNPAECILCRGEIDMLNAEYQFIHPQCLDEHLEWSYCDICNDVKLGTHCACSEGWENQCLMCATLPLHNDDVNVHVKTVNRIAAYYVFRKMVPPEQNVCLICQDVIDEEHKFTMMHNTCVQREACEYSCCVHCGEWTHDPFVCSDCRLWRAAGPLAQRVHLKPVDKSRQPPEGEDEIDSSPWQNQSAAPAVAGSTTTNSSEDPGQPIIPLQTVAAAPTTGMAAPAVCNANQLDPWFYSHYVHLARFSWTTANVGGTLLWSMPISPRYGHANLQHVMKMYNVWAGGLDYKVKIAGTGFHAGAIAIVRTPPNIRPEDIQSIDELTVFQYDVIDPKTLECINVAIPDQRRFMYHYNDEDSTKDSLGGYIGVFVLMQLNTSATGSAQIDVEVWMKAAADFCALQMRPISMKQMSTTYTDYEKYLNPDNAKFHISYTGKPVNRVTLNPATVAAKMLGTADFSTEVRKWSGLPPPSNATWLATDGSRYDLKPGTIVQQGSVTTSAPSVWDWWPLAPKTISLDKNGVADWLKRYAPNSNVGISSMNFQSSGAIASRTNITGSSARSRDGIVVGATNYNICTGGTSNSITWTGTYSINQTVDLQVRFNPPFYANASNSNECVLLFMAAQPNIQPDPLLEDDYEGTSTFFGTGNEELPNIPAGHALLFVVRDSTTHNPLFYVKLRGDGTIWANKPAAVTHFAIESLEWKFESLVEATASIPVINSTALLARQIQEWQIQQEAVVASRSDGTRL